MPADPTTEVIIGLPLLFVYEYSQAVFDAAREKSGHLQRRFCTGLE